jgi:alpha-L-rhamnosidase
MGPLSAPGISSSAPKWPAAWRGLWIWDQAPVEQPWWVDPPTAQSHFTYLRAELELDDHADSLWVRVTCDSRYILFVNGCEAGRGPVREQPPFLGYDVLNLASLLRPGRNTVVALCRYYGHANAWWLPAASSGALGRGSFCFETHPDASIQFVSDEHWRAVPAPWLPVPVSAEFHGVPPEVIDLRLASDDIHTPNAAQERWPHAVVLRASLGTAPDRLPVAPFTVPLERDIPPLPRSCITPTRLHDSPAELGSELGEDPIATWTTLHLRSGGERRLTAWDVGRICRGHIRIRISNVSAGDVIDVGVGEAVLANGVPEIRPRNWVGRIIASNVRGEATFFDAVGFRYLAVHAPAGIEVELEVDEELYPLNVAGSFATDLESSMGRLWGAGVRTVGLCSTDVLVDCPAREQRAWLGDAYVQILVWLVSSPDHRLVRRTLALAARSRRPDGLLAMAAACDFAQSAATIPDYSLHWIRALAAYWLYSGDEDFVRPLRRVAEDVIARYEDYRGASGLLENVPGWIFLDWAQTDRDVVIAAHDALYAAALADYATFPGADAVDTLITRTRDGFEALWDDERGAYMDALGRSGRSTRVSQHTNAAAIVAGIVPEHRIGSIVAAVVEPGPTARGGKLVTTATFADLPQLGARSQTVPPASFVPDRDVVACQPFFAHFLHQALARANRRDLLLVSLTRWDGWADDTFHEFWDDRPRIASHCHGWSATPTYDLTTHILGLRPLTPGFKRAIFNPLLGASKRFGGVLPTPHGPVEGRVDGHNALVSVPDGVLLSTSRGDFGRGIHEFQLD